MYRVPGKNYQRDGYLATFLAQTIAWSKYITAFPRFVFALNIRQFKVASLLPVWIMSRLLGEVFLSLHLGSEQKTLQTPFCLVQQTSGTVIWICYCPRISGVHFRRGAKCLPLLSCLFKAIACFFFLHQLHFNDKNDQQWQNEVAVWHILLIYLI